MGEISSEKAERGDAARSTRLWLLWFATTPTLLVGRSWWAHLDSNPYGEKIIMKRIARDSLGFPSTERLPHKNGQSLNVPLHLPKDPEKVQRFHFSCADCM